MDASSYYYELFRRTQLATLPDATLTKTQMDILVTLLIGGSGKMSSIAERLNIAPEQVTRAMKMLCDKGYVVSERNPDNRRIVIASLTQDGRQMLDEHLAKTKDALASYLRGLSEDEVDALATASCDVCKLLGKLSGMD